MTLSSDAGHIRRPLTLVRPPPVLNSSTGDTLLPEAWRTVTAPPDRAAAIAAAVAAISQLEREIDDLWSEYLRPDDTTLSDRLVRVSRALQQAHRLLDEGGAIG
jgi:hypothetical protein